MNFETETWQTLRLFQGTVLITRSILVPSLSAVCIGILKEVTDNVSILQNMLHCLDTAILKIWRSFPFGISTYCILGKPIDLYHKQSSW